MYVHIHMYMYMYSIVRSKHTSQNENIKHGACNSCMMHACYMYMYMLSGVTVYVVMYVFAFAGVPIKLSTLV